MATPGCSNITPQGERRRRSSGLAALGAGTIVAIGLAWRSAPPLAWLVLFPFAMAAAFGLLQAQARTCVVLGMQGTEEVAGGGIRRVADDVRRAQARRQARQVLWKCVAIAAVVTLAAVLVAS